MTMRQNLIAELTAAVDDVIDLAYELEWDAYASYDLYGEYDDYGAYGDHISDYGRAADAVTSEPDYIIEGTSAPLPEPDWVDDDPLDDRLSDILRNAVDAERVRATGRLAELPVHVLDGEPLISLHAALTIVGFGE